MLLELLPNVWPLSPCLQGEGEAYCQQAAAGVAFVSLNEDVCVQIPLLVLRKSVLRIDSSICWEEGQLGNVAQEDVPRARWELPLLTLLPCDQELLV